MTEYVDWFVNREKQRRGFLKMLADETPKRIMLVEAPQKMGKTWLIQRMRHECRIREVPVAHFDFRDRLPWDYLTIVRQARDDLDPAAFNYLTQVINQSTGTSAQINIENLSVAVNITDSRISDSQVAIDDIVPDDFNLVQADSKSTRRYIEMRVTDAFFVSLSSLAEGGMVIFLLDTFEEAPPEAVQWIQNQLLRRIRDDQLHNIIVIIAGRSTLTLDETWQPVVAQTDLDRFDEPDVREYLRKRGLTELLEQPGFVDTLLLTGGRHPKRLAEMIDEAIINTPGAGGDDDWL